MTASFSTQPGVDTLVGLDALCSYISNSKHLWNSLFTFACECLKTFTEISNKIIFTKKTLKDFSSFQLQSYLKRFTYLLVYLKDRMAGRTTAPAPQSFLSIQLLWNLFPRLLSMHWLLFHSYVDFSPSAQFLERRDTDRHQPLPTGNATNTHKNFGWVSRPGLPQEWQGSAVA